jgi:SAM-dependent methyltransferase
MAQWFKNCQCASRRAAMPIAFRHRSSVAALALSGHERVLEIGCGTGIATRLALAAITSGQITAVDRSKKMIDSMRASVPQALAAGRLVTHAAAIEGVTFETPFDVVFAVNVDLPLRLGRAWADMMAGLLVPGGVLVLGFEAPASTKTRQFAESARDGLTQASFTATTRFLIEGTSEVAIIAARRG